MTTILGPFSGLDKVDPDVLQHAADRGTRVHKICEGIINGLGEIGVDDETWGYVESFKKWWTLACKAKFDILDVERRFWDDDLGVTGQIDLIVRLPTDQIAIIDLKTSYRPSKTWEMQGNGYYLLARRADVPVERVMFLHLNRHGHSPKLIEYPPDPEAFLAVLRVYKHFYAKETNGKQSVKSDAGTAGQVACESPDSAPSTSGETETIQLCG